MESTHGIVGQTHLEAPHFNAPALTYSRLMQSSTRLHPLRQPYFTRRTVNQIEGKAIRKEWSDMDRSMQQYLAVTGGVGRQTVLDTRQQALNLTCGALYL